MGWLSFPVRSTSEGTVGHLTDFDTFLDQYDRQPNFSYCKINHAFWEALADVYQALGRPVPEQDWPQADKIANRKSFFTTGFVSELLELLQKAARQDDPAFHIGLELSAWPNDDRIIGTPFYPERSEPVLAEYLQSFTHRSDGLLLKKAVMDGRIVDFFDKLRKRQVLVVGPAYIQSLCQIDALSKATFFAIHPFEARDTRAQIEQHIAQWIESFSDRETTVLLQAGTLAPYWILRLRDHYPLTKWVDGGLAFSIGAPEDLFKRPWGKVYYKEIANTYNRLRPENPIPVARRLASVEAAAKKIKCEYASLQIVDEPQMVPFVEQKLIDFERISHFLESSQHFNRWANRGPAWYALSMSYERYFARLKGKRVVPCANGGIALQALAGLIAKREGRPLRWCVSAFGFANTDRGFLADSIKVDCDDQGVLSLAALECLDPGSYDGLIVTNPFGLLKDFSAFAAWQKTTQKPLLIDNAAGIAADIPDLPYQSFSLHHTKPFGVGEGGLAIVPDDEYDSLLRLLEYTPLSKEEAPFWVNNGKLSELSCAALLVRLETAPEWLPLYSMQAIRIDTIARSLGLIPLLPGRGMTSMSLPFLAPHPVPVGDLSNNRLVLGKYYKPLANTETCVGIYEKMVNIPSHPGVAQLSRNELEETLRGVLGAGE